MLPTPCTAVHLKRTIGTAATADDDPRADDGDGGGIDQHSRTPYGILLRYSSTCGHQANQKNLNWEFKFSSIEPAGPALLDDSVKKTHQSNKMDSLL